MKSRRYPGFRRYVVLLDYGYGPGHDKLVVSRSSDDPGVLARVQRELAHWPADKIKLYDQEEDRLL